jgi:DNA-binding NarL/FixJ family response regulator
MVALDGDIVERILEGRPDMTVVGRVDGPAQACRAVAASGADVLLLSASGPGPVRAYLDLMWSHPRLCVVVVDPRDERGVLREFRCVERVAGTRTWAQNLVAALRAAARKLTVG